MAPAPFFRILGRIAGTLKANATSSTRAYRGKVDSTNFLYSRYMRQGGPNAKVTPVLDEWLKDGGNVKDVLLSKFIKNLRARNLYWQALEVSGIQFGM